MQDFECFLEYKKFKGDLIEYKCLCYNKNYEKRFDEKLKKRSFNTYKFSNLDINKFILLLRKGIYYEYMDDWEKFDGNFFIVWKRLLLQSPKHEKYYWSRLHACKKSF